MRILVLLMLTAVGVAGCSVESACQEDIKTRLLNPETAEFFQFLPIDQKPAPQGEINWGNKYLYRVKADGMLGNKVTMIAECTTPKRQSALKKQCYCTF